MPAVLLVEDIESNRVAKARLLRQMAGKGPVIAVEDSDTAIRAVRALPCFDLVVTDINLPRRGEGIESRDGVSLARWLRESGYPALLTGYSAIFSEGELPETDRALFFDFLGRAEPAKVILDKFGQWIEISKDHRKDTWRQVTGLDLDKPNETTVPDFSSGLTDLDVIDLDEEKAIKDFIDEGFDVQLAYPSIDKSYGRAFFVWCRELSDEAFVEVFGQPYLYSAGDTIADAKEKLLVLMRRFYTDLKDSSPDGMSKSVAQMRKFLCEVFSG